MVGEEKKAVEFSDVEKSYDWLQMAAWTQASTATDGTQCCACLGCLRPPDQPGLALCVG